MKIISRYDSKTGAPSRVEYPEDDALVFDIECLVQHHNCPVMATAVSSNAWLVSLYKLFK